jgi:hypothetical protein
LRSATCFYATPVRTTCARRRLHFRDGRLNLLKVVIQLRAEAAAINAIARGRAAHDHERDEPPDCTVGISVDRIEMTVLYAAVRYKISDL